MVDTYHPEHVGLRKLVESRELVGLVGLIGLIGLIGFIGLIGLVGLVRATLDQLLPLTQYQKVALAPPPARTPA
jgi:hypothetical protein